MPWSSFSPHAGFSEVRPWLPVSPEHLNLAVDQQEKDPDSVLQAFRRFVAWRKEQPALIRGAIRLLPSDGPILAFVSDRYRS
jgi:alpha-glucosidase